MLHLLVASVIAGIILGAPFGAAGALIAEAALSHDRRRLLAVTLAAIVGDTTLAALAAVFSPQLKAMISAGNGIGLPVAGLALVGIGIVIGLQARSGMGKVSVGEKKALGGLASIHIGPFLAVYAVTILHPGSVAAFLATSTLLSIRIPHFFGWSALFIIGILLGSIIVFGATAILFWRIRHRAARFVVFLRYALALTLIAGGLWLFIDALVK